MALDNCFYCKKFFNHICGPKVCDKCDYIVMNIIKDYLKENPLAQLKDVSTDTNIPVKIISEYIKNGRIERKDSDITFCPLCGDVKNDDMKYCNSCFNKVRIINALSSSESESNDNTKDGMYYFRSERIRRR